MGFWPKAWWVVAAVLGSALLLSSKALATLGMTAILWLGMAHAVWAICQVASPGPPAA